MSQQYFAYGSNLSTKQMQRRCSSASVLGVGKLLDHKLTFPVYDEWWGGGVAGVVADHKSKVEGVVYNLSTQDLKALDKIEIGEDFAYKREQVTLQWQDGGKLRAWIYLTNHNPADLYRPSSDYLDTIINGALEHCLSRDYVEGLKAWRNRGATA